MSDYTVGIDVGQGDIGVEDRYISLARSIQTAVGCIRLREKLGSQQDTTPLCIPINRHRIFTVERHGPLLTLESGRGIRKRMQFERLLGKRNSGHARWEAVHPTLERKGDDRSDVR